jgi:hypothetical protein
LLFEIDISLNNFLYLGLILVGKEKIFLFLKKFSAGEYFFLLAKNIFFLKTFLLILKQKLFFNYSKHLRPTGHNSGNPFSG